ncbi:MAG: O-antigen ligase family protein [Owenweeksia sp.]|nr:O-antigen ligase family protein [Owenweeksia sp.]
MLISAVVLLCGVSVLMGIQRLVTFGLIPLLVVNAVLFYRKEGGNRINKMLFLYLILFLISIVGIPGAEEPQAAIRGVRMFFGSLLCAYIAIVYIRGGVSENIFLFGFIIASLVHVGNIFSSNELQIATSGRDRMELELNSNMYSYFLYFANIALIYLYVKYKNKWILVLILIYSAIFLYVPFVTASRSAIVIAILINSFFWIWVYKPIKKSAVGLIRKTFLTATALLIGYGIYTYFYEGSFLSYRLESFANNSDDEMRVNLLIDAFNVFLDYPLFGAGPGQYQYLGNYGLFSHTSYTEALANQGFFGILILLMLFIEPFKNVLAFRKKDKQVYYLGILVFGSFFSY